MNTLHIVTGQTATGKTDFALDLARSVGGEVINFDARQIYKYLDIISGKDLPNDRLNIESREGRFDIGYYQYPQAKLWLYDVVAPDADFASYDFQSIAIPLIKQIIARGKVPILVGGSYFYLYHLLYDLSANSAAADWKLREKLNKLSVEALQEKLKKLNPSVFKSLNQSDRANPRRLIRRIEILSQKNAVLTNTQTGTITLGAKLGVPDLQIKIMGIRHKDTENLAQLIKKRVSRRVETGAYSEVQRLIDQGYELTDHGLKTIGYQQVYKYLKDNLTEQETVSEWTTREIQYAKRQLTFMKKDKNIEWRNV